MGPRCRGASFAVVDPGIRGQRRHEYRSSIRWMTGPTLARTDSPVRARPSRNGSARSHREIARMLGVTADLSGRSPMSAVLTLAAESRSFRCRSTLEHVRPVLGVLLTLTITSEGEARMTAHRRRELAEPTRNRHPPLRSRGRRADGRIEHGRPATPEQRARLVGRPSGPNRDVEASLTNAKVSVPQ